MAGIRFPLTALGASKAAATGFRLVPPSLVYSHVPMSSLRMFGNIYFDLIDAIAEGDIGYLE